MMVVNPAGDLRLHLLEPWTSFSCSIRSSHRREFKHLPSSYRQGCICTEQKNFTYQGLPQRSRVSREMVLKFCVHVSEAVVKGWSLVDALFLRDWKVMGPSPLLLFLCDILFLQKAGGILNFPFTIHWSVAPVFNLASSTKDPSVDWSWLVVLLMKSPNDSFWL